MKEFFDKYPILKHFLLAIAFLFGLLMITVLWLRFYTNHGEKLMMPDFKNQDIRQAAEIADDESFQIIITDSIFILGVKGGTVLNQNPKAGAFVKSGRKVYVTISKFTADKIKVSDLPVLYGNDFNQKLTELGYRGFKAKVVGRKYDPGEPNHILEVYYKGDLIISQDVMRSDVSISKGDELEFVISDKGSGEITIPSLECLTLSEVEFLLESSKLIIGDIQQRGTIDDQSSAYILSQEPVYDGITKVQMGSKINVTIVASKPSNCN